MQKHSPAIPLRDSRRTVAEKATFRQARRPVCRVGNIRWGRFFSRRMHSTA